jgi:carbon monoxide dehydrogenase subunit G
MKIEKSFELKQPRAFVWEKFSDVGFVAGCLPGASIVDTLGDNRYKGRMSVKVGPMAANFDGEIAIETRPQDWAGVVSGKGADARSSSRATGSLDYRLSESAPGVTQVAITADFNLAGALAQFSKGPVIQEVANRITAAFVHNFEAELTATPAAAAVPGGSAKAAAPTHANTLNAGSLFWNILRDRIAAFLRGLISGSSAKR